MEEDEDILTALIPIYENALTEDEIQKLSDALKKKKLIAEDVEFHKTSDKSRKIKQIFKSIKAVSKRGWVAQLGNILDFGLDKEDLSIITAASFDKNESMLWVLQNWYELKEEESLVRQAASSLTKNFPKDQWLLAFVNLVASNESENASKVISFIKKKLSSVSEPSSAANTGSMTKFPTEIKPGDPLDEIKTKFVPLVPIFMDCIFEDQLETLVKVLKKKKHISENQKKKIRTGTCEEKWDKLTNFLQKNAKATWKEDLTEGIKGFGPQHLKLQMIIRKWLLVSSTNQSGFDWLVTNWSLLKTHQTEVGSVAKELLLYTVTQKGTEPWLPDLLSHCSTSPDDKVNKFVIKLRQVLVDKRSEDDTSSRNSDENDASESTASESSIIEAKDAQPVETSLPASDSDEEMGTHKHKPAAETLPMHRDKSVVQSPAKTSVKTPTKTADKLLRASLHGGDSNLQELQHTGMSPKHKINTQKEKSSTPPESLTSPISLPMQTRSGSFQENEKKLLPLAPLLCSFLDLEKAMQIAHDMKVNLHITSETFILMKQISDDQLSLWKKLAVSLKPTPRQPWEKQFLKSLQRHAGSKLSKVAENFFNDVSKDLAWKWLVYNWTFLAENEGTIIEDLSRVNKVVQKVFKAIRYPECLLDIMVMCKQSPENVVQTMVAVLQEAEKTQNSKMEFSEFSFLSLADDAVIDDQQNIDSDSHSFSPDSFHMASPSKESPPAPNETEVKLIHEKDIEEKLVPLIPLLSDNLKAEQASEVAKTLGIGNIIETTATPLSSAQILQAIADSLKLSATSGWESDFKTAIDTHGGKQLNLIVDHFLHNQHKPWNWFIHNWKALVENIAFVKETAVKFIPNLERVFESPLGTVNLLYLLLTCLTSKDSTVEFLISKLKEDHRVLESKTVDAQKNMDAASSEKSPKKPTPSKKPVFHDSQNVVSLVPLLHSFVTVDDVNTISMKLFEDRIISQETVDKVRQTEDLNTKLLALCESLRKIRHSKWISQFKKDDLGPYLEHVMRAYFSIPHTNVDWRWLVEHWQDLLTSQSVVEEYSKDLYTKSKGDDYKVFLLKLLFSTLRGQKNLKPLLVALSTKAKSGNQSETDGIKEGIPQDQKSKQTPLKLDIGTSSETVTPNIAQTIQTSLFPLVPVFKEYLKPVQVQQLCKKLTNLHHIPEDALISQEVEGVFNCFRDNAKGSWKKDFLDSLLQIDPALQAVAETFLSENSEKNVTWKWFVFNWSDFSKKKKCADEVAKTHPELHTNEKQWALHFVLNALTIDNDKMKTVIQDLTSNHLWNQQTDTKQDDKEPYEMINPDEIYYQTTEHFTKPGIGSPLEEKKFADIIPDAAFYANQAQQQQQQILEDRKTAELIAKSYENESILSVNYDHYFPNTRLPQDHFIMEFQAVVTLDLPPGDILCVYIEHKDQRYPMNFDSRRNVYQFYRETSVQNVVYKYLIIQNGKQFWEQFPNNYPAWRHQNRQRTISYDDVKKGHVVAFDIVHMTSEGKHTFEDVYKKSFVHLLPPFKLMQVSENERRLIPFSAMVEMVQAWLESRHLGCNITNMVLGTIKNNTQDEQISQYISIQLNVLHQTNTNSIALRRVLSGLAYFVALAKKNIPLTKNFSKVICQCLSLHDLNEEEQNIVSVEVLNFANQDKRITRSSTSTKVSLEKIVHASLEHPGCFTVIPLLQLCEGNQEIRKTRPNLPNYVKWDEVTDKFRKKENQKMVFETAGQVLPLLKSFPWLQNAYQSMLSLQTTHEMLSSGDHAYEQLVNVDGVLKKLVFFWAEVSRYSKDVTEKMLLTLSSYIFDAIQSLTKELPQKLERMEEVHSQCLNLLKHVRSLLRKWASHSAVIIAYPGCIIRTLPVFSVILEYAQQSLKSKNNTLLHTIVSYTQNEFLHPTLKSLITANMHKELDANEVELWNYLTSWTWSGEFQTKWQNACLDNMLIALPSKFQDSAERMVKFYADKFDDLNPNEFVANCFTDVVTNYVEEKMKEPSKIKSYARKPKIVELCVRLVNKQWKKICEAYPLASNYEKVMNFLIRWAPAATFIKILGGKDVKLTDKTDIIISEINDAISDMTMGIMKGNINVLVLGKIVKNKKLFAEMSELPKVKGDSVDVQELSSEEFMQAIEYRKKQLEDFFESRLATQSFINVCEMWFKGIFRVDAAVMEQRIESEYGDKKLADIVFCQPFDRNIPPVAEMKTANRLLGTSEVENEELKLIYKTQILSSWYVEMQMKLKAQDLNQTSVTIQYILQEIWIPIKDSALKVVRTFDEGVLSIQDMNWLFRQEGSSREQLNTIHNQIKYLYQLHDWSVDDRLNGFKKCLERIQLYLKILSNKRTVDAIQSLREVLKLTGKFPLLDKFAGLEGHTNLRLRDIDKMKTAKELFENVNQQKLNVIINFAEHTELLMWLMENMKNVGEVKVMSDLAMISAGESPMEVDRVSCFLSAVMGFSPLIFDLPKDANWNKFMEACEEVWVNVDRDPNLEKKWADTASHLEWLKVTKDFHGSVENSSLTRAQLINEHGVYVVGGENKIMPTVDDCLRIRLLKSDVKAIKEDIVMSLTELRDLQSRLMLIAGEAEQGRQDVNRFIDVLSGVENLAKTYSKLKCSGCMLFSNWKAHIHCNDQRAGVVLTVFFDESAAAISSTGLVIEKLKTLTTVLNNAYTEWIKYLNEKRSKYYHLNHYNIHQITFLCKNLAAKNERDDYVDQVYCLLSSVLHNVSHEHIVENLDTATRITDGDDNINLDEDRGPETESLIEKKKKVVRKLVQTELSENVAKAAVMEVKNLDLDECYLWALENEFDEQKILKLVKEFEKEMGFASDANDIGVLRDVVSDKMNLRLAQVIEMIQRSAVEEGGGSMGTVINTVCNRYFSRTAVTSLSDCVSLEHLGTFLELLGKVNKKENLQKRDWPHCFVTGKPNLVICNENVMWRNVISIYMKSEKPTLPTASEVLICSETTTGEDVELFLRRAISCQPDEGIRIYCLVCADKLSFGVAKDVEQAYLNFMQMPEKNEEYRLVILSSSSQHYISTGFDEHQRLAPFKFKEEEIKLYLKKQLQIDKDVKDSVAKADKNRSSVRLVVSSTAGMGKSLYIRRCREAVQQAFHGEVFWQNTVLRFLDKTANVDDVVETLYGNRDVSYAEPHFIHIDATPSLESGADKFFFELVILGSIQNKYGVVWKRQPNHFYAIEYTEQQIKGIPSFFNVLDLLPMVQCMSPKQTLKILTSKPQDDDKILMDYEMLSSHVYQRPYQYLLEFTNESDLDKFTYATPKLDAVECLQTLLKFCSIKQPSWAELYHFSSFLNVQLVDCENSVFTNMAMFEDANFETGLSGFKKFVVKFMIRMSQDFATPSLETYDEEETKEGLFELHQLRRRWEAALHPYMFFNDDRATMSFVHFNISPKGDLCHPVTNAVEQAGIMGSLLYQGLRGQGVQLQQNFDMLSRHGKLATLCNVFGVKPVFEPDPTYELTTDNVLKMLAIHMRFRCDIPVVIMGETGCGKTRMVEFMSKMKAGKGNDQLPEERKIKNMVVIKVHGGITVSIIHEKVREAVTLAQQNCKKGNLETILFLDEANTTEAIYAIKEVVCDKTVHGQQFQDSGLKIVAACNPYRKHSDETIATMEKSGLGFNVKSNDVMDRFAGIPMRHLVYRVTPLPPSMKPLVWDFGQLNNRTEEIYIQQMVLKVEKDIAQIPNVPRLTRDLIPVMTKILADSQSYMREMRDVCSFVSLRDVERTIKSFKWFYERLGLLNPLIEDVKAETPGAKRNVAYGIRALIQAVGMCYHATLFDRKKYRELVSKCIAGLSEMSEAEIDEEIIACQSVFLNEIQLDKDIARNEALRENVFMIIVCAELRIPLFLVGKPGSSKSLAKTIVTDAMQGRNSRSKLFQQLKEIHVLSFQCSAVSDAVGIETMFNQCTQLQKKRDISRFVAVVVLDEIGLAEDSPKMPLKVLHPLLEVGSTKHTGFDVPEYNKVGFVGISNWALDPAKMNRGIFVTRGEPSKNDLQRTAAAIFHSNKTLFEQNSGIVQAVTNAYMEVCQQQKREFFGLRDYYALLKMIFFHVSQEQQYLRSHDISVAVLRNFSGQDSKVFEIFEKHLSRSWPNFHRPHITVVSLVRENLHPEHESRFLLLLTKQYAAVNLLRKVIEKDKNFQVIFGSGFPRDHDYTEVCRNINRIKVCMESGTTVVLLNLRDLYESLYDALNQHYVTFADQRYVDLGLGGHRVKCRIAKNFKLIVIEEKEVVYNEFPIPLINRLEKHVFDIRSILENEKLDDVNNLNEWMDKFSNVMGKHQQYFKPNDAFVGYQEDTAASAVLLGESKGRYSDKDAKKILLQTATLDAVVRLNKSGLRPAEIDNLQDIYKSQQCHDSLLDVLGGQTQDSTPTVKLLEFISFSQCLNELDRVNLERELGFSNRIKLVTLQQLQTMEEYIVTLDEFIAFSTAIEDNDIHQPWILLIQCPKAHQHSNLVACAKYCAMNKIKELKHRKLNSCIIFAFLFTLERSLTKTSQSFTTFHSNDCVSIYVDETRPRKQHLLPLNQIWNMPISEILSESMQAFAEEDAGHFPVDIKFLLQDCIPDAMAKLNSTDKESTRNHVKIVSKLCFEWEYCTQFRTALLNNVINVMKDWENSSNEIWYLQEACSQSALQEGGSFRKVLWLRLQYLVGLVIAKVVSIADSDCNLDLVHQVCNENQRHLVNLWFAYFASRHLCGMKWNDVAIGAEFTVVTKKGFSCQFPFSRLLINGMSKHWSTVAQLNTQQGTADAFTRRVDGSRLSGILREAMGSGNEEDLCQRFASDLLNILYKPFSEDGTREVQMITDAVLAVFKSNRQGAQTAYRNQLLEIFIVYMEVQPRLQCLGEIIAAHPTVMTSSENWLETQKTNNKITIHVSAFKSVLEHLDRDASDIGKLETAKKWKQLVHDMKRVAEYIIESGDGDADMIKSWKQITFIELFLNQLVPRTSKYVNEYLKTISPLARRLWMGASKVKDFADAQFLTIITKTLQGCTKTVMLKVLCNWQDVRCKACHEEKMTDPVQLPCRHLICMKCVVIEEGNTSNCPICRKQIPDVRQLQPLKFTKDQTKEFNLFKMATTSLFLEYLSTFCFPSPQAASKKDNIKPPDAKILHALENLVICEGKTQKISPYLESFDASPTARSFILHLLLRCDKTLVQNQLNQHFNKIGEVVRDRSLLVDVYIQTIQDMLLNRSFANDDDVAINTQFAEDLLDNALWLFDQKRKFSQIENLDMCAELQFVSQTVVDSLHLLHNGETQQANDLKSLVDKVCRKCQGQKFTSMKEYIIKIMCRRYGMDSFELLLENQNYKKCLVPPHLLPQKNKDDGNFYLHADSFALSGQVYVRTKDILLNVTQSRDLTKTNEQVVHQVQQANDSIFQIMLALSTWAARSNASKDVRKETFNKVAQKLQTHLTGRGDVQYFKDISNGALDEFVLRNLSKLTQHKITELIILSGLVYKSSGHALINVFKDIISTPATIATSFLPTMPQSNYFDVKDVMGQERSHHTTPKLYMCPNNHPYYIGECTNPVQAGRCPECGKKIGGQKYGLLHDGNKVGDLTEESQAGYLLKPADERKVPIPERCMTKLSVCATRACLHLALIHASKQGNAVQRALKLKSQKDVCPFLMNQLVKDLKDLAECTGKSVDDAILLMQKTFHNIRVVNGGVEIKVDRMASRKRWEEAFQKEFLSLVFRDTDNIVNEAQQIIIDAAKQMQNPLQRMIHEYNMADEFPEGVVEWNNAQLWKYRTHISVQHLRLKLEGVDERGSGDGALLKMLLNTEHISEIEHLGTILNVQSAFIQRYRQKIDIADGDKQTINQFLADNDGYMEAEIKQYIKVWNKVKHSLATFDKYNTMRKHFTENMTFESPISMCLPSDRGQGCCALVLVEYLVEKQNDVLLKCKDMIVEKPSFRQVDATNITKNNLICINENRDLLPLILANAQYEATAEEKGPKHSIAYNLDLLEQKVEEQFILRRCLIKKETIPHMTYPQDVGLGKTCTELQNKFEQKQLAPKLCQVVDTMVQDARTADICEAVRAVTLIIQFLAKIGGEQEQTICDYAEMDLLLTNDETALIPRAAKICHVIALYERLSWHRTLRAINNGQNPFELISTTTDEKLTDKSTIELNEMLRQINIEKLQNELNSLMMVGPELQPEWGLGEILKVYIDGKSDDPDSAWCDKIPEDVCVMHAQQVFSLSIKHMVKQ